MRWILLSLVLMLLVPTAAADRTIELANGSLVIEERSSRIGGEWTPEPEQHRVLSVRSGNGVPEVSVDVYQWQESGIHSAMADSRGPAGNGRAAAGCDANGLCGAASIVETEGARAWATCYAADAGGSTFPQGAGCLLQREEAGRGKTTVLVTEPERADPGMCLQLEDDDPTAGGLTCLRLSIQNDVSAAGCSSTWMNGDPIRDDHCDAVGVWTQDGRTCAGTFERDADGRRGDLSVLCTA